MVLTWQPQFLNIHSLKNPDWWITSIMIDHHLSTVRVVYEKGLKVNALTMTMEEAQRSGFINLSALIPKIKNGTD